MHNAKECLGQYAPEMRWRALSLAADMDRIQRCTNGDKLLEADPVIAKLREALRTILSDEPQRARRVQMIFSDTSPAPRRNTPRQ